MIKDNKDKIKYILYIVKEHDTLESIANKYNVTIKSIIKINELEDTNIVIGQQLYIKPNNGVVPVWILILMLFALITGTSFITFAITDYINTGDRTGGSNQIDVGTVLYSFNESDNFIDIKNAYPVTDEMGKVMDDDSQYFDFSVGFDLTNTDYKKIVYEISLTEVMLDGEKLDPSYVKVYLEQNGAPVTGFTGIVPLFNSLEDSTIRASSKVLYTNQIENSQTNSYRFRMWVADNYVVDETVRTFKCVVNVDGYVE